MTSEPAMTTAELWSQPRRPRAGLVLTGGGARAAYQIGVLQEILNLRRMFGGEAGNPFEVICGTSSGAINASVLACGAQTFDTTLSELAQVWQDFHVHQVYRSDVLDMLQSGARWVSFLSRAAPSRLCAMPTAYPARCSNC